MIEFNERFSFERDKYQWLLHEFHTGTDKDGNPKQQKHTTFHANIEQVASTILNRSAGVCESMTELKGLFENAVVSLTDHIEQLTSENH